MATLVARLKWVATAVAMAKVPPTEQYELSLSSRVLHARVRLLGLGVARAWIAVCHRWPLWSIVMWPVLKNSIYALVLLSACADPIGGFPYDVVTVGEALESVLRMLAS